MGRKAKAETETVAGASKPGGGFVCVESGFYAGLEWALDRDCTVIGRGRTADLVLSEATISRAHAVLGYEAGKLFVEDLGSTNGTLVNGVRERRVLLADGDELQMGKLQLKIRLAPEAAARHG
jgi:pSer/pThr/pTyr-binding forkhead associated (FHA) protein